MTKKQREQFEALKAECIEFHEKMKAQLDDLCNSMDYKTSSRLSHVTDRLTLFITELNEV